MNDQTTARKPLRSNELSYLLAELIMNGIQETLYDQTVFKVEVIAYDEVGGYDHTDTPTGGETVLTHLPTGRTKVFFSAAMRPDNKQCFVNHMNSMTDDLLLQWFEKRGGKKKEKKDASVVSEPVPDGGNSTVAQAEA